MPLSIGLAITPKLRGHREFLVAVYHALTNANGVYGVGGARERWIKAVLMSSNPRNNFMRSYFLFVSAFFRV